MDDIALASRSTARLTEMKNDTVPRAITIHEDNQSTISMARSLIKHISIKYHFVRDHVIEGAVKLKYCPTKDMIADMLTKGLSKDKFIKLRKMAGVISYQS